MDIVTKSDSLKILGSEIKIKRKTYPSFDLASPAASCITDSINLAMILASSPLFCETDTEPESTSSVKGKVVAAVARPLLDCGKVKKEPKSKLNKFGRAKITGVVVRIMKRRQT